MDHAHFAGGLFAVASVDELGRGYHAATPSVLVGDDEVGKVHFFAHVGFDANAVVTKNVVLDLKGLAWGEGGLRRNVPGLTQETDEHEGDAQVDHVAAVASPSFSDGSEEGGHGVFFCLGPRGCRASPEFLEDDGDVESRQGGGEDGDDASEIEQEGGAWGIGLDEGGHVHAAAESNVQCGDAEAEGDWEDEASSKGAGAGLSPSEEGSESHQSEDDEPDGSHPSIVEFGTDCGGLFEDGFADEGQSGCDEDEDGGGGEGPIVGDEDGFARGEGFDL